MPKTWARSDSWVLPSRSGLAITGESGEVSRFEALRSGLAPLVGRDEEIQLLRWRFAEIVERTDAALLFIEQLTKAVLERADQDNRFADHARFQRTP